MKYVRIIFEIHENKIEMKWKSQKLVMHELFWKMTNLIPPRKLM